MERVISVEEKIRRAEEIYNRRNGQSGYRYQANYKEKKGRSLMGRMIKQIIVCFMIYGLFYVVTNRQYYLSQEFQDKVASIAAQNETTFKAYNYIKKYVDKYFEQSSNADKDNTTNEQNMEKQDAKLEQIKGDEEDGKFEQETSNENVENLATNNENIGGAEEETIASEEKSQEEKDIEEIKNTTTFIQPITGTITSTFGWRTPTTATVPKYHTGIDLAAKTGTVIKAATDGKVILASSEGDYGKHYKIQIGGIILIYAHCSKLYLNEGEWVTQGQEIAEVGSTGNSTRSTFTF